MSTCVECHKNPPECNFTHHVPGRNVIQSYNICGKCAADVWAKFRYSDSFLSINISSPKTPTDFQKEAKMNGSDKFGSSWCEYNL